MEYLLLLLHLSRGEGWEKAQTGKTAYCRKKEEKRERKREGEKEEERESVVYIHFFDNSEGFSYFLQTRQAFSTCYLHVKQKTQEVKRKWKERENKKGEIKNRSKGIQTYQERKKDMSGCLWNRCVKKETSPRCWRCGVYTLHHKEEVYLKRRQNSCRHQLPSFSPSTGLSRTSSSSF